MPRAARVKMPRLLRLLTSLALTSCCVTPPPVSPRPIDKCRVLVLAPPPALHPVNGTLPPAEEKALTKWISDVAETRRDLDRCSLVEPVTT